MCRRGGGDVHFRLHESMNCCSLATAPEMTYESTQTRVFLQQYLLNQLCATNNVFVKIRVLNLFIILLEEGHIEFKQNLRKQPEAFNEASSKFIVDCRTIV